MPWTLGGKTISPDSRQDSRIYESYYAIQEILDATVNTLSFYGASSERRSLQFILDEDVNSNTGLSGLRTAIRTDADVALVSDKGAEGNYRILSLRFTRLQALNHTNPVYECAAELIKNE